MKTKSSLLLAAGALAFGVGCLAALAGDPEKKTSVASAQSSLLERGEYLVRNVGLCTDCHSPRDERGEFITGKHLTGAPIPFAPTVPMPAWAPAAPPIAGLPEGWSDAAMVRFLTTGQRPFNLPPARPPMPPFRMNAADAEAVVAYLRAVK